MNDDLRYKYKTLRKYFQSVRREEADKAIAENFLAEYSRYTSFFIYNSFGTEADTSRIVDALLSQNKQVFLPRTEKGTMFAVPFGKTRKGAFGIMEPEGKPFFGKIEVTVAPLLAINCKGFRLGYGGGYYDKYLKNSQTLKVGLGYAFQLTDDFKESEWDEPMQSFVCEKGIYYFGN